MMRFAIGFLASFLSMSTAMADQLLLRADVLVRSDVVTLGDLVDGLGEEGQVSVFSAPGFGRSGTIQVKRILEAAHENGLGFIDTGDLSQITVRRAGREITTETVSQTLVDAMVGEYGLPRSVELQLDPNEGFFVEPQARVGLRVRSLELDRRSGRFTADIVSNGAIAGQSFKVTGALTDEIEVPVLIKDINRNSPIDASDIALEKRPRRELPDNTVYDPAAFAQMIVTRSFRKGEVLRASDIAAMPLVARGDLVTLIVEVNGMTLSTRGKALQGGTAGTVIAVQNVQTKRSMSGTIAGPGKVLIGSSQPAIVASANR
jgi:flagellar basal body P-ring formation protein FlgA